MKRIIITEKNYNKLISEDEHDEIINGLKSLAYSADKENVELGLTIAQGQDMEERYDEIIEDRYGKIFDFMWEYATKSPYELLIDLIELNGDWDTVEMNDSDYTPNTIDIPDSILDFKITKFVAVGTPLSEIPESVLKCTTLKHLELSYSNITVIPDTISNLKNLDTLILNKNKITNISPNLQKLNKLKTLVLSYNKLKEIPEWIGNMQSLEEIGLNGNREIKRVPKSLVNLNNLQYLGLPNKIDDTMNMNDVKYLEQNMPNTEIQY